MHMTSSSYYVHTRPCQRGVGITEACGTGATAAAIAAVRRGLTDRRVDVQVHNPHPPIFFKYDSSLNFYRSLRNYVYDVSRHII